MAKAQDSEKVIKEKKTIWLPVETELAVSGFIIEPQNRKKYKAGGFSQFADEALVEKLRREKKRGNSNVQ